MEIMVTDSMTADRNILANLPDERTILIVDDDKPFSTRLARAMEARGFDVRNVQTVRDGKQAIRVSPPAFAVIDLRLEDGSGLEVMSLLKELRPEARAIILTGYGNIATAVNAVKLGAIDYLAKPADADDIMTALFASSDQKIKPPENPMSADRVRWEHIQRVYEMCSRNVSETAPPAQHASPHLAAYPRQACAEVTGSIRAVSAADHLVLAANTLGEGVDWIASRLGVKPETGGQHQLMGTHNAVMKLGTGIYLEIIAIDPSLPEPSRPRWFSLDDPRTREALSRSPRLVGWIARTDNIDAAVAASPVSPGTIEAMSRGEFNWRITIPADGSLPEGGAFPHLIQWGEGMTHPSVRLPDRSLTLAEFTIRHPEPLRLRTALEAIGLDAKRDAIAVEQSQGSVELGATIVTPSGPVKI